jgi:hypothetical protein
MIKFAIILIMFMVGCTAQVQPTVPSNSNSKVVVEVNIPKPDERSVGASVGDGIEKGVGAAGKLIWNVGKGVWEVVNNEEYQKRVREGVGYIWDWGKGVAVKVGKIVSE